MPQFITGKVAVVELPNGNGLYLIPEDRISDYDDPRRCNRCGRRIGYARAAKWCVNGEIIHCATFDCTDERNW